MHKTAAHRSIARRAVLTKAAFDLPQIAGIAGIAGGTLGLNSAINNREQSVAARVGKGVIGTGLGYAGAKLMTDPKWQAGVRKGLDKARALVSGLVDRVAPRVAKTAEAAYVAGFCKAAETLRVDPVALYKQAALKPGAAFRLVRTALEGRRGSELGGKVLAAHSFLSGTGRLSRGTADNLAHMLRLDEAMKGVTRTGYLPYKGRVTLPSLVRAAHLDIPAHDQLSGAVTSTSRSEAVKALLREMGYGK